MLTADISLASWQDIHVSTGASCRASPRVESLSQNLLAVQVLVLPRKSERPPKNGTDVVSGNVVPKQFLRSCPYYRHLDFMWNWHDKRNWVNILKVIAVFVMVLSEICLYMNCHLMLFLVFNHHFPALCCSMIYVLFSLDNGIRNLVGQVIWAIKCLPSVNLPNCIVSLSGVKKIALTTMQHIRS